MSNAGRPFEETARHTAAYHVSRFLSGSTVQATVESLIFFGANYGRDNPWMAETYTNEYPNPDETQQAGETLVMEALFGPQTLPQAFVEVFKLGAILAAYNVKKIAQTA